MEMFFVTIFSLEYLVRILVAKEKTKFIFSFWGIIDLLAILPFYLFAYGMTFDLISTKTAVFALNGSDIFNSKACVVLP